MRLINVPIMALALALAACGGGGGGGGGLNSTPPFPNPTPTPTPTPVPLNTQIFANPVDGPLTVFTVGRVSDSASGAFVPVAVDASAGFELRYIAAENRYEVRGNGVTPSTLIRYDPVFDSSDPYRSIRIAENCCGDSFTAFRHTGIGGTFNSSYNDAALLSYRILDPGPFGDRLINGYATIGRPTPAASVPTTGTATFSGFLYGEAFAAGATATTYAIPLYGTVALSIDFGAASVGGSIFLQDATDPNFGGPNLGSFGTFMLANTTLSSSGYMNGGFVSSLTGTNLFQGQLAGPTASEAFGRFAVPFQFDSVNYQAGGAWVAKR